MGDRKLTLFEYHSHGETQFGPKVLGDEGEVEAELEREESAVDREELEGESGASMLGTLLKVVAVVAVLALGATAAKRLADGFAGEVPPEVDLEPEEEPEATAD